MHLADLFDPPQWQQRKVEFVSRRQGPLTDHIRNTHIVQSVRDDMSSGMGATLAIKRTAEKFVTSEDNVKKIWGKYRALLQQVDGPLPSGRPGNGNGL
jgi:hypothetical protein